MAGERVLIVDDEARLREMIMEYLVSDGFAADEAGDGREALEKLSRESFSIVILDVMMPGLDGWTVLREIRRNSQVPVIMLSARGEEYDKLFGFELGVDDYVLKPFSPKELMARIKAVIRRSGSLDIEERKILSFDGLVIKPESREALVDGKAVNLTPKEFDLLSHLAGNPNRVYSREQLLNKVWGYDFSGDYRTVDTHVKMLRESIGAYRNCIVTVWGVGYKFRAP